MTIQTLTTLPTLHISDEELLNVAKNVISIEKNALSELHHSIGDDFINALKIIKNNRGRIIISGMGKSGHIGVKIAATLASTGTPSFFVHPAEASHGDLGMITHDDVVVCLSNSGETEELGHIITYTNRHNIPLIAIVSQKNSTLARASTVALVLPKIQEACPNGLAPTTSTTLMLALGDALAVSLMHLRSFTPDHFRNFHPGGKLGAKLLKVSDLMRISTDLPLVSFNSLMSDVIVEITVKALGCAGVVDDNRKLVGVITDGDLRRSMSVDFLTKQSYQVMTHHPHTIEGQKSAAAAVSIMERFTITGLWIIDDVGIPIGFLHLHDCLRSGVV